MCSEANFVVLTPTHHTSSGFKVFMSDLMMEASEGRTVHVAALCGV
jgi:hypothetical protein